MPEAPNNLRREYEAYDSIRHVFLLTQQLKPRCKNAAEKFEKVSRWPVGHHIEHVLTVNARALPMLAGGDHYTHDPGALKPPNAHALKLLEAGVIQRGFFETPESLRPGMTNFVDLAEDVERGSRMVEGLIVMCTQIAADESLHAHPLLGALTRMQWLRFMEIHTQHHLKIIGDIVGRNG